MNDQQRTETAADNCEVLRARLAKYEDAEGRPLRNGLRYTSDGELAECPCCGSLDVGGANGTVSCYGCDLQITKPRPLQNAADAWNKRAALKAQPSGVVLPLMAALESVVHDERVPNEVSQEVAAVLIEAQCLNSSPVSAGDDRETIRAVFLRNGFTIKEGQADLKPYVYAAADELMSIARAALSAPSHGEQVRDGWAVSLMGPDEVVRIQRKDGKWCGVTHLSESPRDRLLYEFLRTIAAPSAGSHKEQGE